MDEPIAIIGMSCRFPEANNNQEFWQLLSEGKSAIKDLPLERLKLGNESKEAKGYGKRGGFLKCPIDEFDAHFFGISTREAPFMDPQQRLLLEVSWEALENSGINPQTLKGTPTGVFIGIWSTDYNLVLLKSSFFGACEAHDAYLGTVLSAVSARISFFFESYGPNMAIDAGCASSLQSLHLACDSLRRKETNICITGGVNLILGPKVGKYNSMILSSDGLCKTFDVTADGFGRADGCGILILKRLSDAEKDGDNILALVRGSAVNCDGSSSSFGAPCKHGQAKVIKEALQLSNLTPEDINYIEAHGTGTQVGDPVEFATLNLVFAGNRKDPLIVSSVKTNIGHSEAAAGVAGLIKIILSLQNELIPPHLNLHTINPAIDINSIPVHIPIKAAPWQKTEGKRRIAGISAFALSGHNAHIIIEEAPVKNNLLKSNYNRPLHIMVISGKTESALQELSLKYSDILKNNSHISVADVAYTSNTGRAHFPHRLAVIGKDFQEIQKNLESQLYVPGLAKNENTKIAFLFSEQNIKFLGISKSFYDSHPVLKSCLDECSNILDSLLNESLLDTIFKEGNESGLRKINAPAVFSIQYSLFHLWKSFGIQPDYVLGYGTGEFVAAAVAGILSLDDALKLVVKSSEINANLPAGVKLGIKTSFQAVQNLLTKFNAQSNMSLNILAVNSPEEVILVGKSNEIKFFSEFCLKGGIKTWRIPGSHALSHSTIESISEEFQETLSSLSHSCSKINYVSGMTGKLLGEKHFIYDDEYWGKHMNKTVNFANGIKSLCEEECNVFIEIGAHPVLMGHLKQNFSSAQEQQNICVPSLRNGEDEWVTVLKSLAHLYVNGLSVDWKSFDAPFLRQRVDLPTYPFQRQKYWAE